jgi:hypothetical protein
MGFPPIPVGPHLDNSINSNYNLGCFSISYSLEDFP